jgi:predicted kinase
MKKVFILCGIPGSGKSTWAQKMQEECEQVKICSADYYFLKTGEYKFDALKLGEAHGQCLKEFVQGILDEVPILIVDNTNTRIEEMSPYASLALAYGYELCIVYMRCVVQKAHDRNVHNVSFGSIKAMFERIERTLKLLPKYWQLDIITN